MSGCSRQTFDNNRTEAAPEIDATNDIDEEGAVQEPAWTYFERLSIAFGCDSSCIGITDDMILPDWYSGCFVNSDNRLTINVIGDSLQLRRKLEKILRGNEFDVGKGLYSKNEQRAANKQIREAADRNRHRFSHNISWSTREDGTIDVFIEGSDSVTTDSFRTIVYDSPLLRIHIAPEVGITLQ